MTESLTDLSTFSYHNTAAGESSVHPRPRCACGGIFDPHEAKDAAVCRACGKEVTGEEHSRAMTAIVNGAVTMAAIKFGHGPEMLPAAQKLVADFGKKPTR